MSGSGRTLFFQRDSLGSDAFEQVISRIETQDLLSFSQASRSNWHEIYPSLVERFCHEKKTDLIKQLIFNAYLNPKFFQTRLPSLSLITAWKKSLLRVIKTVDLPTNYLIVAYTLLLMAIKQQFISRDENESLIKLEKQRYEQEFDTQLRLLDTENPDLVNAINAYLSLVLGKNELYQLAVSKMRDPFEMCEGLSHNEICILLKPFCHDEGQVTLLFNRALEDLRNKKNLAVIRALFSVSPAEILPRLSIKLFSIEELLLLSRQQNFDEIVSIYSNMLLYLPQDKRLIILTRMGKTGNRKSKGETYNDILRLKLIFPSVIFLMRHIVLSNNEKMAIFHAIPFKIIYELLGRDIHNFKLFAAALNKFISELPSSFVIESCLPKILDFLGPVLYTSNPSVTHVDKFKTVEIIYFSKTFSKYNQGQIEEMINIALNFDRIFTYTHMSAFIANLILALTEEKQAEFLKNRIFPLMESVDTEKFASFVFSHFLRLRMNCVIEYLKENPQLIEQLMRVFCNNSRQYGSISLPLLALLNIHKSHNLKLIECISGFLELDRIIHSEDAEPTVSNGYQKIDECTADILFHLSTLFKPDNIFPIVHLIRKIIPQHAASAVLKIFKSMLECMSNQERALFIRDLLQEIDDAVEAINHEDELEVYNSAYRKFALNLIRRNIEIFEILIASLNQSSVLDPFLEKCYRLLSADNKQIREMIKYSIVGLIEFNSGTPLAKRIYDESIIRMEFGTETGFARVYVALGEEFLIKEGIRLCLKHLLRVRESEIGINLAEILERIPYDAARIMLLRMIIDEVINRELQEDDISDSYYHFISLLDGLVRVLGSAHSNKSAFEVVKMILSFSSKTTSEIRKHSLYFALRHILTQHLSDDLFTIYFSLLNQDESDIRKMAFSVLSRMVPRLSDQHLRTLQISMDGTVNPLSCDSRSTAIIEIELHHLTPELLDQAIDKACDLYVKNTNPVSSLLKFGLSGAKDGITDRIINIRNKHKDKSSLHLLDAFLKEETKETTTSFKYYLVSEITGLTATSDAEVVQLISQMKEVIKTVAQEKDEKLKLPISQSISDSQSHNSLFISDGRSLMRFSLSRSGTT